MPEAIANLAPPRPPTTPPRASARPETSPARRSFDEQLQRAAAPADDAQPTPQAVEPDAKAPEKQPDQPIKPAKPPSKKPPIIEPDITVTMQPQTPPLSGEAVSEATAGAPPADATLLPLTADLNTEQPLEASDADILPEDAAEVNISAVIQLPPPTPDAAPISTTTPPLPPDDVLDSTTPVQAAPPLTPSPDHAERDQESFSAGFEQPTPLDAPAPSPAPLADEEEPSATPIETIDDPSAHLTPSRDALAAKTTEHALNPADTPEPRFTDDNHPRIITALRSNLSHNGGSVTIRLDPPGLGEVQVSVELRDGMMIASIQTSTDDATRLMSHSLGQLKRSLESSGLAVEKLHVQQAPRDEQGGRAGGDDRPGQQHHNDGRSAQQEQQRREILERVWRRLRGGRDPIDFVV